MEGAIFTYRHHNGKLVGVVEVSCQTDFAARTETFSKFGDDLAMHIAMSDAADVDDLLKEDFLGDPVTVAASLDEIRKSLREDVKIQGFHKHQFNGGGLLEPAGT